MLLATLFMMIRPPRNGLSCLIHFATIIGAMKTLMEFVTSYEAIVAGGGLTGRKPIKTATSLSVQQQVIF